MEAAADKGDIVIVDGVTYIENGDGTRTYPKAQAIMRAAVESAFAEGVDAISFEAMARQAFASFMAEKEAAFWENRHS